MNKHVMREDIVISTMQALRSYGSSWSSHLKQAARGATSLPSVNGRGVSADGTMHLSLKGEEVDALVGELEAIERLVGPTAKFANCQIGMAISAWRRLAEETSASSWGRTAQFA